MTITIDGKAFECLDWKITTNTDANSKINLADLRLRCMPPLSQISQKIPLVIIPSSRIAQILGVS